MTLLERYVVGQLTRPMMGIIVAALVALLAERTLRVVDLVIGWRGSLLVIFEMLGYLIPHYMGLALPAALFIAILLTVGRLSRDGELDAMLASGAGFMALLRPLLLSGLVVTCLNAAVQCWLQPYSRYAYRAAVFALSDVSFQFLLKERQFATLGDTTYMVDKLSRDHDRFDKLFLTTQRSDGSVVTITAERGHVVTASGDEPTTLQLENGVQQSAPSSAERVATGRPATTLRFRNFTSDIHGDTPGAFNPRGTDERELTVPELFQHPEGFPERAIDPPEIAAELHVRLVRIASTLVLPLVAAPLAIVRQRARRSYGFVLGIGLLLLFNQLIQLGKTLADNDKLSVGLALWMPLALFTALGLWLSIRKWRRVPTGGGPTLIERAIERLAGRLRRRLPLTRKTAS